VSVELVAIGCWHTFGCHTSLQSKLIFDGLGAKEHWHRVYVEPVQVSLSVTVCRWVVILIVDRPCSEIFRYCAGCCRSIFFINMGFNQTGNCHGSKNFCLFMIFSLVAFLGGILEFAIWRWADLLLGCNINPFEPILLFIAARAKWGQAISGALCRHFGYLSGGLASADYWFLSSPDQHFVTAVQYASSVRWWPYCRNPWWLIRKWWKVIGYEQFFLLTA